MKRISKVESPRYSYRDLCLNLRHTWTARLIQDSDDIRLVDELFIRCYRTFPEVYPLFAKPRLDVVGQLLGGKN